MRARSIFALLFVLLLAVPAFAQEQGGAIEGVVKDSSGAVLPGVTVEARAAGAVATQVTDGRGAFRFPSVLPGTYTVTATLSGFTVSKVENLQVVLGSIKSLEFTLKVAGVSEEVQVKGEAPLVDTKQSARATSLTADQIDLLPKGRDFTTILAQAPGTNNEGKSGGIMIDGASAGETRYIIDGAETTNIIYGNTGKNLLVDFLAEVQVKSSGYSAEFGGATGGVVSAVTKSGTDKFHGNALYAFQNSGLQGPRRPSLRLKLADANNSEYITYNKDSFTRQEPGFSLGGPIITSKAWFFGAYQPTIQSTERTVKLNTLNTDGTLCQFCGEPVTKTQKTPAQYLSLNQTSQLGSKIRTRVAYNNSWAKTEGALPALDGSDKPGTNYNYGNTYPNWSVAGEVNYLPKSNVFISARTGYYMADQHSYGIPSVPRYSFSTSNIGMAGVPADMQKSSGYSSVPTNSSTLFDQQKRISFQVDGTVFANFAGQHQIKGGLQIDHLGNSVNSGEMGNLVTLYWGRTYNGVSGTYGYYRVRSNGAFPKEGFITQGDVATNNYGLFIQDAWTINNRLTLNLGLRTENEKVPAYTSGDGIPTYGIEFSFKDKLAPRVGFAYDIKGDGKWKAYGSWGMFYDIFKLNLPRGSFGGEKWLYYYYALDTPNWTTLVDGASCPPTCTGTLLSSANGIDMRHPSFGSDAIDPSLKPMASQEASLGIEHQLGPTTAVSFRWVHKWLTRAVDDTGSVDAEGNEIYVIANPGEGLTASAFTGTYNGQNLSIALPKAKRVYDSLEFSFRKNLANNWSFSGSYLWSRTFGNYSGLSQTDENGRQSPNTGRLYDYPMLSFDQNGNEVEGPLGTDRPHQLKGQVVYMFKFGTTVGVNQVFMSGLPITREMPVGPASSAFPLFYMGRGSDGRTPWFYQTDFQVSHEFSLAGGRRIHLGLNVLNLFDQKIANNYFPTYLASGYSFKAPFDNQAAFYAHAMGDWNSRTANNTTYPKDPRFLQWNGFQGQRQARLEFKFLF